RRAWLRRFRNCFLSVVNNLIERSLIGTEFSIHRKRARYVGSVVIVLGADVHQQELAWFHRSLRFDVMERRRIWTTTDDIGIAPVVCISELERVRDLRIHFIFPFSIGRRSPRALVRLGADVDRVL